MARCLAKELHVHYGSGHQRSVQSDDRPLEIQNQFLRTLGYTDSQRIQLEGLGTELGSLFKFVTGTVVSCPGSALILQLVGNFCGCKISWNCL